MRGLHSFNPEATLNASDNLVLAAAEYLKAGLSLIALQGKVPHPRWHPHGLKDAMYGIPDGREDVAMLVRIFEEDPKTTGIGIVIPALTAVVDIDGENGAQAWRRIVGEADFIPVTPVAKTSRGFHIWFISAGQLHSTTIAPGLDLKALGGYVAAPPSAHPSGARYEWLQDLVVAGRIVDMDWLPVNL